MLLFSRLETTVETDFRKWCKKEGLYCIKLNMFGSYGIAGFPDRLVLGPNRLILFIEFKRPGKKIGKRRGEKLQQHIHRQLRGFGFDVICTDSKEEAQEAVRRLRSA